jgi:hypothetical protein
MVSMSRVDFLASRMKKVHLSEGEGDERQLSGHAPSQQKYMESRRRPPCDLIVLAQTAH